MDIRRGREIHQWHKQQLGLLHKRLEKNKENLKKVKKDREETKEEERAKGNALRGLEEVYTRERELIINEIRKHEIAVRAINQLEYEHKNNKKNQPR